MKKILILSLGPVFKDYVHGGSQKILRELALHWGKLGNKVTIYCTYRKDNSSSFFLHSNVEVRPLFRFKETFPVPYLTAPYNLEKIITTLLEEKKKHDIIYAHDSGFNFPFIYDNIPTVSSLRDFHYPETLLGAFLFERDLTIVNSEYTYQCVLSTIGKYRKLIDKRVVIIPNGIDLNHFKKTSTNNIRKIIKLNNGDIPILYPHRPENSKGLNNALEIIAALKNHGLENIKLLIPKYIDLNVSSLFSSTYRSIVYKAKKLNIESNIVFHPWIQYDLMPEYYSLGKLTLSVGNFIESFPNVSLESLACGTPSISTRVAAHRTVIPESIEPRIDYGDINKAAKIAFEIIKNNTPIDVSDFLKNNFNYETMLNRYTDVLLNCKVQSTLKTITEVNMNTSLVLCCQ